MDSRVVGWTCDEEWLQIYKMLFYGEVPDQRAALDVINVWRSRFGSRIPVAIEATARLLEAWLHREHVTVDARRQIMCAAVTQFVGLLTERGLKGNTKKPIHEIGEDLGIPEWLVNLRHEMAHGPLPSLLMIEKAVLFALDWLKDNHWDVHLKNLADPVDPVRSDNNNSANNEVILSVLFDLVSVFCKKGKSAKAKKQHLRKIKEQLETMIKVDKTAEKVCELLVQHQFLKYFPTQLVVVSDVKTLCSTKYFEYWQILYELFVQHQKLPIFLYVIVTELCSVSKKKCTVDCVWLAWCLKILQSLVSLYGSAYNPETDCSQKFWNETLKCLILNSGIPEIASLFKQLTEDLPGVLAHCDCNKLYKLFKIIADQNFSSTGTLKVDKDNFPKVHLTFLEELLSSKKTSEMYEDVVPDMGAWKLADDTAVDMFPIGLLPGQANDFLVKNMFSHINISYDHSCNPQSDISSSQYTSTAHPEDVEDMSDEVACNNYDRLDCGFFQNVFEQVFE